jgi:hypothetical protein
VNDDWLHRPCPTCVLLFGLFLLVWAVVETFTGKIYYRGLATERTKDPTTYWLVLIIVYVTGLFLIWKWAAGLPR